MKKKIQVNVLTKFKLLFLVVDAESIAAATPILVDTWIASILDKSAMITVELFDLPTLGFDFKVDIFLSVNDFLEAKVVRFVVVVSGGL